MILGACRRAARMPSRKGVEIAPQFALAERGLEMRMQKFNRVFQRDDMDFVGLVDFVQHGRQRGGLAAAGAAGHKNEAVLFLDDLAEHRRQVERFQGGNLGLEPAQHHRVIAVLAVDVDAEPAKILQGITAIARTALRQVLHQPGVVIDDGPGQPLDAFAGEHGFRRFERKRLELAVNFHLRRLAGHEQQIRNALGALNHGRQQPVEFFCRDRFHHSDWDTVIQFWFPAGLAWRLGSLAAGRASNCFWISRACRWRNRVCSKFLIRSMTSV